jgi:hypothetical protein
MMLTPKTNDKHFLPGLFRILLLPVSAGCACPRWIRCILWEATLDFPIDILEILWGRFWLHTADELKAGFDCTQAHPPPTRSPRSLTVFFKKLSTFKISFFMKVVPLSKITKIAYIALLLCD